MTKLERRDSCLGADGDKGNYLRLLATIINSAGHSADFFWKAKLWKSRNTTEGHDCQTSVLNVKTSWA